MAEQIFSAEAITCDWLNAVLTDTVFTESGPVSDLSYGYIGTGKMGDNARLSVRCADGISRSLIAKLPAKDEKARAMAGAQGAYYNEVMFYRDLAAGTSMRTPEIYHSNLSEDRTAFILLMEDLSPAEPGNQLVGESADRAKAALSEAAKLAAAYYGDDSIGSRDYVMSAVRDDGGAFGQALMEQNWPGFVDRFGHGLSPECIAFGEHYVARHAHFVSRYQGPKTLAHGDFRSENILFGDARPATVDWQTLSESSALTDTAYFLGGSLEVELRRAHEKDLVAFYRDCLAAEGVSLSAADCDALYREYAMHGLMITVLGAMFSEADERGDAMFLAMARRHLQQCVDLGSREFLD